MFKTTVQMFNRLEKRVPGSAAKKAVRKKKLHSVHLIADLESPRHFIEDPKELRKLLWDAAIAANNTPLKSSIHKFPLQGITGVVILAESHIAIHTWPECGYMAIDIFTCGKQSMPYKALDYLTARFKPKKVKLMLVDRGMK